MAECRGWVPLNRDDEVRMHPVEGRFVFSREVEGSWLVHKVTTGPSGWQKQAVPITVIIPVGPLESLTAYRGQLLQRGLNLRW